MDQEDNSPSTRDRDEHPSMNCEAEDRSLRLRDAMARQRSLDSEFEWTDGTRRAGDQVREVGKRDRKPGADAVDGQAEKKERGGEDHAFARPDDGRLQQKKQR